MGWFGNLLDKISIKRITGRYMDINGGTPIFSQFGQDIYASDVVQQAVSCIAQEMKKLRPAHIRDDGTGVYAVKKGDIAKILNKPNQFQTTADFLESITTLLFLNYNVFIIPTYYEW